MPYVPSTKREISWTSATTVASRLLMQPTKSSPRSSAVCCHLTQKGSWGSTTSQIFSLVQILEICEYNLPTHQIFIDFKAAALANHARERFLGQTNSAFQGNLGSCDVSCARLKGISGAFRITSRVTTR